MRIKSVHARQIINAKGHPTLQVEVATSKNFAFSSVPIAASKSKYEFYDSYDNDLSRFHGETLSTIVDNIERVIAPEFIGKNVMDQEGLDQKLLDLDATLSRTHLGVNTISAISQSVAKLGAIESDLPLFKYIRVLHDFTGVPTERLHSEYKLPVPVISIYKSSLHDLKRYVPLQELMVMPKSNFNYARDLVPLFDALSKIDISDHKKTFGEMIEHAHKLLVASKFKMNLGVDMAASRYKRDDGSYVIPHFNSASVPFTGSFRKLVDVYAKLISKYKLAFVEDLLDEDDYSGWKDLIDSVSKLDHRVEVVSDDFTATNMERLEKIGMLECSNNVVVKPSQAGTLTECVHFAQRARKHDQKITVSYRNGETEDTFISDLAVGLNAQFIRTGSHLGSEHNAKLNRLLQIEDCLK